MKTSFFTVLIIVLFSCSALYSQDTTRVHYKHSIGFCAGFTTGYGFSYRFIPKKFGFQLTFAPFYTDHGKTSVISAGFTLLRRISETRGSNFYVYFANHYFYNRYASEELNPITYTYNNNTYTTNKSWNTGIGIDFEWHAQKRIVLNLMAGIAQYNTFASLLPTGEIAIYYRF